HKACTDTITISHTHTHTHTHTHARWQRAVMSLMSRVVWKRPHRTSQTRQGVWIWMEGGDEEEEEEDEEKEQEGEPLSLMRFGPLWSTIWSTMVRPCRRLARGFNQI